MEPDPPNLRPVAMRIRSSVHSSRPPAVVLVALAAAACTFGPGASAVSSPVVTPSSAPATAAEAFAAVQARSPYFDGVQPRDPQAIGQAAWWEASPAALSGGAWGITVSVGWGDCPAGCISNHVWRWSVGADGTTTLAGESGPPLPEVVRAGLAAAGTSSGVGGIVTAGPTCPVVRPGESGCDDRPVADAVLVVRDAGGAEAARFATDGSGLFRIALAPGSYTLEPQPRAGLLGTAQPEPFTVAAGRLTFIAVSYDTGIR